MNPGIRKYVPIKSSNLFVLNAPRASAGLGKTESPGKIPAGNSNFHASGKKANRIFQLIPALKGSSKKTR